MEIIPWNPLQHLLLPTPVTSSQQSRWCWIFVRSFYTLQTKIDLILTQIQRWIWEKQLIKPKVQRLPHDYLLHTTPFHASFFSITFPWTPPHTRTNNLSHTLFSSSFSFFPIHTMPSFLVSLHDLPWACSPCPMKALKSFCTNQWPPHPSRANENLRMNGHPIEIKMSVATLLWAKRGGEAQHSQSWGFGVLQDSRMFRARQKGRKHLVLKRYWCHWKGLET